MNTVPTLAACSTPSPPPHSPRRSWPLNAWALVAAAGLAACASDQKPTASEETKPAVAAAPAEQPAAATPATPATAATPAEPKWFKPGASAWTAWVGGQEMTPPDIKMGDTKTIAAILDEGKNRSRVMEHLTYLTQQIGPRLTGSKRVKQANEWCAQQYTQWGLTNVNLEQWGEIPVQFNRGPCTGRVFLNTPGSEEGTMNSTKLRDLDFTSPSWTAGTKGPVRGPVVWMPTSESEYTAIKSKLKGAWVLMKAPSPVGPGGFGGQGASPAANAADARRKVAEGTKVEELPFNQRIYFDGINGCIVSSRNELVLTGGGGWRTLDLDKLNPDIVVSIKRADYDAINSRVADGDNIAVEFDLQHEFVKGPIPVYNTVAEIKGTHWPEQVVVVSGHLDSWDGPGAQGAVDNGTGTATTLEAARILMAVGAKPKRTIRFIAWTGEEQGLLGSAAYVRAHADEMKNISAALIDDGGTNYNGGLSCTNEMVPMLAAATAPINGVFKDDVTGKPLNCNLRPTARFTQSGGSDHMSFVRMGVPGFFWTETGRADYNYAHHTQHDKIDQAIPVYLQQSATCAALTAYQLACADTLLPRDNMPTPGEAPAGGRPGGGGGGQGGNRGGGGGGQGGGGTPGATPPATPARPTERP